MIIKRCGIEDVDKVYAIEEKSFPDPMKKETFASDLKRENYYCYGLWDGDLTAFISYEKVLDEAQVISVAVDAEHRRKGYGRKLFEEVLKIAREDGIEVITLEVRSENTAAVKLYEAMGFERVGVRKNYYSNPVCDALLMDLHLRKD